MQRREDRKELKMAAKLRAAESRSTVEVSDLSEYGCKIDMPGVPLQKGDRVAIRPERFESLFARVRWANAQHAGFEFDRPLYPPIVDHLCELYSRKFGQGFAAFDQNIGVISTRRPKRVI